MLLIIGSFKVSADLMALDWHKVHTSLFDGI